MKKILVASSLVLLYFPSVFGQLVTMGGFNAQQLADNLAGQGITVTNAVITGANTSFGQFTSNNTNLGIGSGVILTSGRRSNAIGPNNDNGVSYQCGTPGDAQLDVLAGGQTFDACVLEFDFQVQSDMIEFHYVFGSDEYPEFVGAFNDVFAFYISGPGIVGQENIALVPGTQTIVSINNINDFSYWQYYVNNDPGPTLQYDGLTTVLTAKKTGLIPCQTYHLKLAVADALDEVLDTGVFLEEGSLVQGSISGITNTALGDSTAVEGCTQASFTFTLDNPLPFNVNIPILLSGTATNGIDYAYIDTLFTIPAGQISATIFINAIADGIGEGIESVQLMYQPRPCEPYDTVMLYIEDNVPITFTASATDALCYGDSTGGITINITGGTPPFTVVLNGVDTFQTLNILNLPAGVYGLEILDGYGCGAGALAVGGNYPGQPLFLPDGGGNVYTTSININGFPGGTVLTDPNQLQFVSVSMEHSFISDVGMRLYAPNGSYIQLKERPGGNHNNFGEPVANGPVDTNNPDTTQGICYQYFFNNNPVHGTMVSEAGNYNYTYIPVTGPPAQTDSYIPAGSYEPYQPFSNLLGAPLNGNWTLWVKDYKPQDNGWICTWGLSFALNLAGDTVIIGQPANINATAVVTNATCGVNNGSVNLTTTGPFGPFTWLWSTGATTEDINTLAAGVYTVTITNNNGCTRDTTFLVQNNATGFTTSVTHTDVSCMGGNNGSVDLTVTGGANPWTYLWSNGATTQDLASVPAGTYSVTVTGTNNCVQVRTAVVSTVPSMNISAQVSNEICGQQDGSIDLTVSAGNNPYSFLWSNGSILEDPIFLQSGTYSVTVTDNAGCTATSSFGIINDVGNCQVNCNLSVGNPNITNENCGNSAGSINVTTSGGYPPLSYVWSNGLFTEDIYNLSAGTYSLTITDAQGCTSSGTYAITNQAGTLTQGTPVITSEACGNGLGSIDITVSGGNLPYIYQWSNGATTQDVFSLNAGNFSVTITDGTGCSIHGNYVVTNNTGTLQQTWGNAMGETCGNGQGSIDITIINGFFPYNFAWSNGANTEDILLLSAGNYQCTITDGSGCSLTTPVYTITNNAGTLAIANLFVDNEVCSQLNGRIRVIASGGTLPYTYTWSNGATTDIVNNLAAGTYYGTITDASGCSVTTGAVTVVNDPGQLVVSGIMVTDEICGNGSGILNLTATSPNIPITYLWNTGSTSEDLYNLNAGTYYVTVSDTLGCTLTAQATVQNSPGTLQIQNMVVTDETCANNTGAVNLVIAGGAAPVTYAWSNGAITQDISSIHAGTYSVTVQDVNGCMVNGTTVVNNDAGNLVVTSSVVTQASCGMNNGAIDLTVSGTPTITYNWSNGGAGQDLVNLSAGTFTCTITDGNSCSLIAGPFVIQNTPGTLQISGVIVTDETCNNAAGAVNISVSGGGGFYTYVWSNGPTTQDISGLGNGNYTVTVSDINGCTTSSTYMVNDDPGTLAITSILVTDEVCNANNGAINISVTGGGPYTYAWSNGPTTQDITGLTSGTYSCTITSGTCVATTGPIVVTNNPGSLSLVQIFATDENCGNGSGEVNLVISGGNPPVTFLWNTGATTQNLTSLSAGVYSVVITDASGCQINASTTVYNAAGSLTVNSDTITNETCGNGDGSIHLGIGGANNPVTYLWSNGATTQNLNNISAGTYTLLITDGNGCQLTWSGTVMNTAASFTVSSIQITDAICAGTNGAIDITISGGTSPYTYLWSNGAVVEDPAGLNPGNYTVVVTDALGCTTTASATVGLSPGALTVQTFVTNDNCGNGTGSISLQVNGINFPFSFFWSNGAITQNIAGLSAGTYSVTVADGLGCTTTATAIVANNGNGLYLAAAVITDENCGDHAGAINITVNGGTSPYSFAWSNGATTEDISGLAAGTFTVTVTDATGCDIVSIAYPVNNNTGTLTASASITDEECGNAGGAVDLLPSGGAGGYTYSWSTGAITQDVSGLAGGTYTVTVTDGAGCALIQTYVVGSGQGDVSVDSWIVTEPGCQTNDGSVDITVSTSYPPLSYVWSNGAMTEDINNLAAGNYSVTVTDAHNCQTIQSFVVSSASSIVVSNVFVQDDFCSFFQGQIDVIATGGTGMLEYTLDGGFPQNFGTFWGLSAGNYTIVITDSVGCSDTVYATVGNTTSFVVNLNGITQASCAGCADGAVNISVAGAQPPVDYFWSNGAFTQDINNVLPGTYYVTVSDQSGCQVIDTFVVTYSTGIANPVFSFAEIFPNPNEGNFTLHYYLAGREEASVEIHNLVGVTVFKQSLISNSVSSLEINLNDYASGIYFAVIHAGDFEAVRKIVIRR